MKRFGANTFSNIAAKLWSLVSIYVFVPLYIKYLGESSYGLVSFFTVLQSSLSILGLGLSNTLRREFAVGDESNYDNRIRKYKLLRSVENIYFLLSGLIILICFLGAETISNKWLNIESLNPLVINKVISIMGVSIALQFETSLYSGCLFGLNKQVYANLLQIIWAATKSVGSVFIAWKYNNLVLFYMWHCLTDLIYLVVLRLSIIRCLYTPMPKIWKFKDLSNMKSIWKYTAGILFISLIALVNKQLDKVVISKYLTLTELGAYNVANTLGSLISVIPSALYVAVFPRFTEKISTGENLNILNEFVSINKIANIFISVMGSFIALFSTELIKVWTSSDIYTNTLGLTSCFVVLAVGASELQEIPYALALANGNTRTNVMVGGGFLPIVFVGTFFVVKQFGLIGAGIMYFVFMFTQSLLYEYLIYKKYLSMSPIKLIIKDTIFPIALSLAVSIVFRTFINSLSLDPYFVSILAIVSGAVTLCIFIIFFSGKDLKCFIKGE